MIRKAKTFSLSKWACAALYGFCKHRGVYQSSVIESALARFMREENYDEFMQFPSASDRSGFEGWLRISLKKKTTPGNKSIDAVYDEGLYDNDLANWLDGEVPGSEYRMSVHMSDLLSGFLEMDASSAPRKLSLELGRTLRRIGFKPRKNSCGFWDREFELPPVPARNKRIPQSTQ